MRGIRLMPVLVGLAAIATLTADASAVYHPTMGRFLQRDPGPGPATPARLATATPAVGVPFAPRDPAGNQYADGINPYRYAEATPPSRVDPQGTTPMTCERVLSVTPNTSTAFAWVSNSWQPFAVVPDAGVNYPTPVAGEYYRVTLHVKFYVELYKCCNAANIAVPIWGELSPLVGKVSDRGNRLPWTTINAVVPIPIPLSYGQTQAYNVDLARVWHHKLNLGFPLHTTARNDSDVFDKKWSDYRKKVPSGYKLVDNIDCCAPGNAWPPTGGGVPPAPTEFPKITKIKRPLLPPE